MNAHFVADGESRLRTSEGYQARERELRESICARYSEELSRAGFLRRCVLRAKMFIEHRRERRRMLPSRKALYLTHQ
jgi:hypothetical protein